MNNSISISRIGALLRMYCIEMRISLLTIFGIEILAVCFVIGGNMETHQFSVLFFSISWLMIFFIFYFSDLMGKRQVSYIALPSTAMEKFISVVLMLFGLLVALTVVFALMNVVYNLLFYSYLRHFLPEADNPIWRFSFFDSGVFALNPFSLFYGIVSGGDNIPRLIKVYSSLAYFFSSFSFAVAIILWGAGNRRMYPLIGLLVFIILAMPTTTVTCSIDLPFIPEGVIHGKVVLLKNIIASRFSLANCFICGSAISLLGLAYYGFKEREIR